MFSRSKFLEHYIKKRVAPVSPFNFIRISRETFLSLIHPFRFKLWLIKLAFKIVKIPDFDEDDFLYFMA